MFMFTFFSFALDLCGAGSTGDGRIWSHTSTSGWLRAGAESTQTGARAEPDCSRERMELLKGGLFNFLTIFPITCSCPFFLKIACSLVWESRSRPCCAAALALALLGVCLVSLACLLFRWRCLWRIDNIVVFVNLQCCPDKVCKYMLCLLLPVAADEPGSQLPRWLILP